jgi:hypothetical protein
MKTCFTCKEEKPLSEFAINRMKYQVKSDLGHCIVCYECEAAKALRDLSVIRYNFDTGKFEVHKFETEEEVINFLNLSMTKKISKSGTFSKEEKNMAWYFYTRLLKPFMSFETALKVAKKFRFK